MRMMHCEYYDIRSRIAEEPTWWDEHAVPRYGPFSPYSIADMGADECVLLLIQCASCTREFQVAMSISGADVLCDSVLPNERFELREQRYQKRPWLNPITLSYGDPPNIQCCAKGPRQCAVSQRVLEFWNRGSGGRWVRRPEYEIEFGRTVPDAVDQDKKRL